jgi:putative phosphoesterase
MNKKDHHHIYFQNREHVVVGVISDTHGILVPGTIKALHGVDLIIHAGDIGNAGVMDELKSIAPVVAVRGNMDMSEDLRRLPETEAIQVGDALLYIIHDINKLDIAPSKADFDAVIFGHLHYPSVAKHSGVLFVNPGSASQPRCKSLASLAFLHVRGTSIKTRIMDIDG